MSQSNRQRYSIADLQRVMERLRDPVTGCPWDVAQTFSTIVPSTLEECYELAAAIEQEDYPHVAEELGDVLFQVIFYAQLGREQSLFGFEEIVDTLVDKLLRRHPHVFGNDSGSIEAVNPDSISVDQVMQSWEAIKQAERDARSQPGALADVPIALPALPRAQKLQKRAARVGFDWRTSSEVLAKLEEEILELKLAIAGKSADSIEDEMGDVFFSCVNLARHLGLDAETSLRRASRKFETRFQLMESLSAERGLVFDQLEAETLDGLWCEAKIQLNPDS
jgi:ATP diphosphatase